MNRRDVVSLVLVTVLFGSGIFSSTAPPAEASSTDDVVVVLYDTTASLVDLNAELTLVGWSASVDFSTLGVMRIEPDGLLSSAMSVVIAALEALPAVRAAEENADMLLHKDLNGKQSIFIIFDDELDAADIRPQSSFSMMGIPTTAPTPSSYTPSMAFLDGGFVAHEVMPSASIVGQFDAIDNDTNAFDTGNDVDDDSDGVTDGGLGHGTGMAGSALVVCPHADLYLVRMLDDEGNGSLMTLAAGLSWANQQSVDVINISAGMANSSPMVDMLIDDAVTAGTIVVAAAGNDSAEGADYPASHPDVVAVGGVDEGAEVDTVSNYATGVFISAPSASVAGMYPDATDDYGWWSGTSIASALVAGAAAYLTGENPNDPEGVLDDLDTNAGTISNVPTARVAKVGVGFVDIDGL